MTVRWKPLLILSGLFVVVALIGVVAISSTLSPGSSQSALKQARAARDAGRLNDAEIYFKQAIQLDPKSAALHEELADLYAKLAEAAPAERRDALLAEEVAHLDRAANLDKSAKGPRERLLQLFMADDAMRDAVYWAREVEKLDAQNADANYILALGELEADAPKVAETRRRIEVLEERKAPEIRRLLVQCRLAAKTGDDKGRDAALDAGRAIELPDNADPVDLLAKFNLASLDATHQTDPAVRVEMVKQMLAIGDKILASSEVGSRRVTRLSHQLEGVQRELIRMGTAAGPEAGELIETIEKQLASVFERSRSAGDRADFQIFLTYADHLRFRQQRDRCLGVVDEALKSPLAIRPASARIALGLRVIAAGVALAEADDPARVEKAAPHVQALLAATEDHYQGLGHLFQGAVDLEASGVVESIAKSGGTPAERPEVQPKLLASALSHLKTAAAQLPDVAEAQARYGVALVLNQEQGLGRQYLQNALKMGDLDPQYQFWAAWTILKAGYPEEAAPILDSLHRQLAQGTIPAEMKVALHQISGELFQTRRGEGDLDRAAEEFRKVAALSGAADAGAALRLAQIEVQQGRPDAALAQIEKLRSEGKGGPGAENLAAMILEQQGKKEEARAVVAAARAKYPTSTEMVSLDAILKVKDGKAEEADQMLAEFLAGDPGNVTLAMLRASVLAESNRIDDARKVLTEIGDRADNSAPLVQLTQLEIANNNFDGAAAVIAKIRGRWREAAAGDVLDAQLSLKQGRIPEAIGHFNEALKKDPENKVVQFWKAQLDRQTGATSEAAEALERIVRDGPIKEVDAGVSLMAAAQSSLAGLSLQNGNVDDAIRRYEELRKNSANGTLTRDDRWQLIAAYDAKDQWPTAKRELAALLNDPNEPASPDDRVRGADYYRRHKEDASALAQIDYVQKVSPANAPGAVMRAVIHLQNEEFDQAAAVLRKAIELSSRDGGKPAEALYLMLAVVENATPPKETGSERALKVIDEGLAAQPASVLLAQSKYLALSKSGDPKDALAFVETKAKEDPKGPYRRMLIDVYRDQKNFDGAETLLRELAAESPDDANVAAALVEVVSLAAADAVVAGDAPRIAALEEKTETLIREYRTRFPSNLAFLQAECDQAARRGDFARAVAVTEEIDKLAKGSAAGPLLRARLYTMQDRPREVAKAYAEAVEREPRRLDARLLLGKTELRNGNVDEALRQAEFVLETKKGDAEAALLQARALDASGVGDAQREAARSKAVAQLESVVAANPRFAEAHRALAEIEMKRGRRPAAVEALKRGFAANPTDGPTLAQYVQLLSEADPANPGARPIGLDDAKKLADEVVKNDVNGSLILAAAVGFHKAQRLDLALPLAEKAAEMLDSPVARLNLGDLLLSLAESQPDPDKARAHHERAVEQYDLVLKERPDSVEAVNNKAWILHSSLGRSQEALELINGLLGRVDNAVLPGEFYDTLGVIQEAAGKTADAEKSYQTGLERSPGLAVLHYHYGKLIAADKNRGARAKDHLDKALAARGQLSPAMAEDAVRIVQEIGADGR